MKNLQEIMNEMSILNEQIAVTLNDEEIKDVPLALADVSVNQVGDCGTVNRTVPYCCAVNFPLAFHYNGAPARILYDLNCLSCTIVPCCNNGVPRYDIRVVGSIPFIVNVPVVTGQAGQCVNPVGSAISACCHSCVCVNNTVANRCTYEQAVIACETLRSRLRECSQVTSTVVTGPRDQCVIRVTGTFTLPTL